MLDKYSNSNDIIKSTSNVDAHRIEDLDSELLISQPYEIQDLEVTARDNFELHVYTQDGNHLTGNHNIPVIIGSNYAPGTQPPYNIQLNIKQQLNELSINRGQYKILVNFFDTVLGNYEDKNVWVKEISPSRREVRITMTKHYLDQLQKLIDLRYEYLTKGLAAPLVLNFGKNNTYQIVNFKLEPKIDLKRILEDSVPTNYIEEQKLLGIQEEQAISNYAYKNGPEGSLVRTWKNYGTENQTPDQFYLIQDDIYRSFNWNAPLAYEYSKYLDSTRFNLAGKEIRKAFPYLRDNGYGTIITNFLEVDSSVINIKGNDLTLADLVGNEEYITVIFKLYTPIDTNIGEKAKVFVSHEYRSPYADNVILVDKSTEIEFNKLRPANFNIDAYAYQSIPTEYKSWNNLLDSNLQTSQKIIDLYFSGSLQGIPLNVNYGEFENFVHFSSAEERVRNFKYKLELIEFYTDRINSLSGSASTNLTPLYTKRNAVVSTFDNFENYLFYQSGSQQIYTHVSYSIAPWPKLETSNNPLDAYPHFTKLYRVSQSVAEDYFNDLVDQAQIFDNRNVHRLLKTVPYHIRVAEANEEFNLFVDMLGHHYDIVWTYIKHYSKIFSREEHPKDGMSDDLLYSVAKSLGFQLYNGRSTTELWKYAFGTDNSGSLAQNGENGIYSLPDNQVTKEYWRRLVNNLPYLLKTKGTARSVRALLSCFGIPSTLLTIKEFGGPTTFTTEEDFYPEYVHDKFVFAYKVNTPGYKNYLQVLPAKVSGQGFSKNVNALEFTFRTDDEVIYTPGIEYNVFSYHSALDFENSSSVDSVAANIAVTVKRESATDNEGTVYLRIAGKTPVSMSNTYVFDNGFNLMYLEDNGTNTTLKYTKAKYGKIVDTGSIFITDTSFFTDVNTNTLGAMRWGNPGTASINSINISPFSGHIQEIRLWSGSLNTQSLFEHALSPETYTYNVNRNALTGNEALEPYNRLVQRYTITNKRFYVLTASFDTPSTSDSFVRTYQLSAHPNQKLDAYKFDNFSNNQLGGGLWLVNVSGSNQINEVFDGFDETYYTPSPSLGGNSLYTNKVRIESNSLTGFLSPKKRVEVSSFDKFSNDSNKIGIYFSPQDSINEDIFNQLGYFEIDDYIGDPGAIYTEHYPELEDFAKDYWIKYDNKNDFEAFFRALSIYDMSIFRYIKDMMPYRANVVSGFLVQPNVLERKRFKTTKPTVEQNLTHVAILDGTVVNPDVIGTYNTHEASIEDPAPTATANYLSNQSAVINVISDNTMAGEYKSSVGEIDYDYNVDKLGTTWSSGSKHYVQNRYVGRYVINDTGSYTPIQTIIVNSRYDILDQVSEYLTLSASLNGLQQGTYGGAYYYINQTGQDAGGV